MDTNASSLFTAEKGAVLGPYLFSEGNYRLAKLADVQYRPDSVQARHILIAKDENKDEDSTNALMESIKEEIESGKDFANLAQQHTIDRESAIRGGEVQSRKGSSWFQEGEMAPEFNEVCFTADKGELTIVQTKYGIHLIEVTKKSRNVKKVKIAYIDRIVEPSSETSDNYYTQALQFAGALLNTDTTTFDDLVAAKNLGKRNEKQVSPSKQNISGVENSREMIRWMRNANVGQVQQVSKITFLSSQVQNDHEPELVGLICASEKEVITQPIVGNNAVFVAKVISRNQERTSGDFSQQQVQILQTLKQSASTAAYNAVKENAGIIDNRNDFY